MANFVTNFLDKVLPIDGAKPATKKTNVSVVATKHPSTQQWSPLKDVYNNLIHRKDNSIVAAIRVQPLNIDLLSDNEKLRKIKSLEEVLNGIDYEFQTLSIAKPVDLDAYILKLDSIRNKTEDLLRIKLLSGYIQQAAIKASSGEALERHFYVLIDIKPTKKQVADEQNLLQRARELAMSFSSADLISHVCSDDDLRDLQFIFSNPNQAAYERSPLTSIFLPPVMFAKEIYNE